MSNTVSPISAAVAAISNRLVSIHAPRCRGAMPISRNYREQKAKTAVLREPPAFRAENILLESTSKLKRQEIQRLAARANLPGKCRSLDVRASS